MKLHKRRFVAVNKKTGQMYIVVVHFVEANAYTPGHWQAALCEMVNGKPVVIGVHTSTIVRWLYRYIACDCEVFTAEQFVLRDISQLDLLMCLHA